MILYNSLTRKKQEFAPLNPPKVGVYVCGPTVYDYQHIGNFRTMILSDILVRTLKFNGFQTTVIRNVTDIDDKIIRNASAVNKPIDQYTEEYTCIYFEDLKKLNILPVDANPKATEHVQEIISFIEDLLKKGLAYKEDDGSIYFAIGKFPDYGKLSNVSNRDLKTGTRILSDEYTKDNVQDFALWKATKKGEVASYDSPWGKGRPGWHIECSVMSQKYLGETFDIHVGGKDLIFPHHENEIAQSEARTGKPFVRYWVHGEMLMVESGKMSKSLKNFYLLRDLEAKGFDPLAYRYLVLTAHYRDFLNFTWQSLEGAQNALNNLRNLVASTKGHEGRTVLSKEKDNKVQDFTKRFREALNDDLNTPQALAVLWEALKSNIPSPDKYDLATSFDEIFGLKLQEASQTFKVAKTKTPQVVEELIAKREQLRKEGKFKEADKIRNQIADAGYDVEDTSQGAKLKQK